MADGMRLGIGICLFMGGYFLESCSLSGESADLWELDSAFFRGVAEWLH